jgi:sialic acid synthase SpsE
MFIIAELCGQHGGNFRRLEQMILQAKYAGADAVKVQLYDTFKMPGEHRERWEYLGISFEQLKKLKEYCSVLNIELFASFFDEERLSWCCELGFTTLKIASSILQNFPNLAEQAVATGKRVIISLGMYDWKVKGKPFSASNVEYLYCLPRYPGTLENIDLPIFDDQSIFTGYSDHSPGITASCVAIARGARILEKHFTISKNLQRETEKGHFCSMDQQDLLVIRNFADEYQLMQNERGHI